MTAWGTIDLAVKGMRAGAYCLPRCWKHIIQIKDHKEYFVPGGHKPNKDGLINID